MSYTSETGETFESSRGYTVLPSPCPLGAKATKTVFHNYTMKHIDALEAGRNNFILVMVDNPKKGGSIASDNWHLYGKLGEPTVTVAAFIKSYPTDNRGVDRARASLLWDLNREYIKIVNVK